jgi:hypothetical protein
MIRNMTEKTDTEQSAEADRSAISMVQPEENLLRLLPHIRRARDFRLYTGDGGRLVDLWQYGGTAILGHTPPGVLRALKNTAERGLFAPLPSHLEARLTKALSRLFPHRAFRLYAGEAALRRALTAAGFPVPGISSFPDPAILPAVPALSGGSPDPAVSFWRPFLTGDFEAIPLLIPVLPLAWPNTPWVLALDETLAPGFPPSDILSPVTLAAAERALYDLVAAPGRGSVSYPRINRVLPKSPWTRRGIYLHHGSIPDDQAYAALFRRFLVGGFLLPPSRRLPLILPGLLSPGEESKLTGLLLTG